MGEGMRLKWLILHWQTQDLFDALNIQSPGNEIDGVGGIRSACIIRVNQISLCWQTKMETKWLIN